MNRMNFDGHGININGERFATLESKFKRSSEGERLAKQMASIRDLLAVAKRVVNSYGPDRDAEVSALEAQLIEMDVELLNTDLSLLRDINLEGHRLRMWDDGTMGQCVGTGSRTRIRYELRDRTGKIIFQGNDFSPSPLVAIDSDESVKGLLGFLTLRPGDTDDEYFQKYDYDQRHWMENYAEALQIYADDEYESGFEDWI